MDVQLDVSFAVFESIYMDLDDARENVDFYKLWKIPYDYSNCVVKFWKFKPSLKVLIRVEAGGGLSG